MVYYKQTLKWVDSKLAQPDMERKESDRKLSTQLGFLPWNLYGVSSRLLYSESHGMVIES